MLLIPHSYPSFSVDDRQAVDSCFAQEYVGYDDSLEKKICDSAQKYVHYPHQYITPSASLSLLLLLKILKISTTDEVLISSINCWSVYNLIAFHGAKPVLCDVRATDDFRASYSTITEKITENTKIIIITHMFGGMIENATIQKIKVKYPDITLIEDFSTSFLPVEHHKYGLHSDFGIASFGSTKPITGGVGGLLYSHHQILSKKYDQKNTDLPSFNMKISRMDQALLLSQLNRMDEIQHEKNTLLAYYGKYVNLYCFCQNNMFRAITFQNPIKLIETMGKASIQLDIRSSAQPNLSIELENKNNSNAYNFQTYYSLPLHARALTAIQEKGLL
jgi:dTDP-4-amino-4,6-dideoxygalactose transaminase